MSKLTNIKGTIQPLTPRSFNTMASNQRELNIALGSCYVQVAQLRESTVEMVQELTEVLTVSVDSETITLEEANNILTLTHHLLASKH